MALVTLTISAVSRENDIIIYEQEYIGSNNAYSSSSLELLPALMSSEALA